MVDSYIIGSVRTVIGKLGGTLKDVTVDLLAEKVIREVLYRCGKEVEVDEVILGQAKQSADTSNLARLACGVACHRDRVYCSPSMRFRTASH